MIHVLLLATALLLAAFPASANDSIELSGSLRSLSQIVESSPLLDDELTLSSESLRLEATGQLAEQIEAGFALENQWLYNSPVGIITPSSETSNTVVDLTKTWREDERWSTRLHIDRIYLRGRHESLRWTAGRQAFGFGSIVLFSPLDIIAPFPPDAIDTEYRVGIDALRIDLTSEAGDLFTGVAVFDDDSDLNSYLTTASFNRSGVDLQLLAGSLRERVMGGVGLAGYLGGLGLKGEISWYEGKDVDLAGGDLYEDFPVGAVELWYRFDNDVIMLFEYLHNGAGSDDPIRYPEVADSATLAEGLSSLLGQNYLLVAPSYEVHPLLTVSALGIWNIDDDSYMFRPQASLSLADNLSLDISHTFNRGDNPLTTPLPGLLIPQSEFGLYGDSAAIYLRWYF